MLMCLYNISTHKVLPKQLVGLYNIVGLTCWFQGWHTKDQSQKYLLLGKI